jgi:transposase-like protein
MKLNLLTEVLRSISTLTINQKHRIVHRIHAEIKRGDTDVQIDACKGDDVKCPHCGSNHMGKWGASAGLQRYRCKSEDCRRTVNALTKTPLARLRKRSLWQANLDCMFDGLPLWRVAEELGISITTAFRWQHRFLKAPTHNKPGEVTGIIEADEMFFLESFKGKRTIQNVNNYMSRFRTWMVRFHGVGTAYLANYLGWMRMMEDKGKKIPVTRYAA